MEGVTLAVAAVAAVMVMAVPRRHTMVVYLAALVWYPAYLSVPVGTVDFTVSRIVILVVLAKILLAGGAAGRFRWNWVDRLVLIAAGVECVAGLLTSESTVLLENRAGAAFDTVLVYFAVRLSVGGRRDYAALLGGVLAVCAPLAVFGAYQCLTGSNPLGFLRAYAFSTPLADDTALRFRHGLWRAEVTFPMPIMFGLLFAMMGPACAGLWKFAREKAAVAAGLGLMLVGMASSLSSGPWLAGLTAGAFLAFYPLRRYWKAAILFFVVLLLAIEIGSNRHWYYVLASYGTLNPETAHYRIGLMREAFTGGMSGHWLLGYGAGAGLGGETAGWEHTDITNHYVLVLLRYGLTGLVPFLALLAAVCVRLRRAFAAAVTAAERWAVWCVLSALAGVMAAMFSVSLFGQPRTLLYVLFAFASAAGPAAGARIVAARRPHPRPAGREGVSREPAETGEAPR